MKAILIGINIINSTCACYIYKAGSRPKIYIATTINTWRMLSTTIWADKKYASFWPISKNLKQYCNLDFNLEFSIQSIMYFQKIEKRKKHTLNHNCIVYCSYCGCQKRRSVFRVLLGMYNFAPDENSRSLQQQQHMNLESYIDPMTLNIWCYVCSKYGVVEGRQL